jgi:hypothetical protein
MDLYESLNSFCLKQLSETNDWYSWRIEETKVPIEIKLPGGNQYLKNLILKEELHKAWNLETAIEKKGEIIKYYINDWGGIRTNSASSMNVYIHYAPDSLIKYGEKGIPSWSKALVIHDPEKYAIFDARVSVSLNCLQIVNDVENKVLYPILGSRNKTVTEGQKIIRLISKRDLWVKVNKSTFYDDYLKLLKKVANDRNTNISTVEMLLFAKAEMLINEIKALSNPEEAHVLRTF